MPLIAEFVQHVNPFRNTNDTNERKINLFMWFKSDISIYDRDDFQLAWDECNCLDRVWEWVQRESIKQESETIRFKNALYLRAVQKKLKISEAELRDAQRLLGELGLIIFDDPNEMTLPDWLLKQGLYFAKKQSEAIRKAEYREKQKQEKENYVPRTEQGQDKDVHGKSDIREEKIREEKIREELNNLFINKKHYIAEKDSANEKNQEAVREKSVKTTQYSEGFEKFWEAYKRKGSKSKAFIYWKKFKLEGEATRVLAAVELYNKALSEEQFRKYAEGWLNGLLDTYLELVDKPQLKPKTPEEIRELKNKWFYAQGELELAGRHDEIEHDFETWLVKEGISL